jgi:aerobic-type carbon monoxide dehydrogenase small subunit (CoxS/CutS family)
MTPEMGGAAMPRFTLTVNGRPRDVEAASDMPLVWVLRERLGLTGTKFGCGVGICGSCVILRDGAPVRSCQLRLSDAVRGRITTIEGLSEKGDHPVQRAWLEEDVAQCGYCQPGMLLCAAALLSRIARPADADVDAALAAQVCRCGSYPRIRRAVRRAAGLAAVKP